MAPPVASAAVGCVPSVASVTSLALASVSRCRVPVVAAEAGEQQLQHRLALVRVQIRKVADELVEEIREEMQVARREGGRVS